MLARATCSALLLACLSPSLFAAAPPEGRGRKARAAKAVKEVAGSAEYLRSVPKRFATLQGVDAVRHRVSLLIEGENLAKVWPLADDAEVKVAGWWGRIDQLHVGDRVWVWFQTNRKRQPVAVAMLADEISEQHIHGGPVAVEKCPAGSIRIKDHADAHRTLALKGAAAFRGARKSDPPGFRPGSKVYVQSAGKRARLLLDAPAFEARRSAQKAALRKRWIKEGLPGGVSFVHRFSGEMDLMLDHEAMRWGRSLQVGDRVTLAADPPIRAVVKSARPWRERTLVRLVARSRDITDLRPGQRLHLRRKPPAPEVDSAVLPPDVDRPRAKAERIEWFLATIYCTCGVTGNVCTGHFYTLASCNPNGCGTPRVMRKEIAALIAKGLTDRQILQRMLKEYGPDLLRPHLLP